MVRSDATVSNLRPLYVSKLLHDKEVHERRERLVTLFEQGGPPLPRPRRSPPIHTRARRGADPGRGSQDLRARGPGSRSPATCARLASLRSIGERREAHSLSANWPESSGAALRAHRRMQRHALTRAERIVPART